MLIDLRNGQNMNHRVLSTASPPQTNMSRRACTLGKAKDRCTTTLSPRTSLDQTLQMGETISLESSVNIPMPKTRNSRAENGLEPTRSSQESFSPSGGEPSSSENEESSQLSLSFHALDMPFMDGEDDDSAGEPLRSEIEELPVQKPPVGLEPTPSEIEELSIQKPPVGLEPTPSEIEELPLQKPPVGLEPTASEIEELSIQKPPMGLEPTPSEIEELSIQKPPVGLEPTPSEIKELPVQKPVGLEPTPSEFEELPVQKPVGLETTPSEIEELPVQKPPVGLEPTPSGMEELPVQKPPVGQEPTHAEIEELSIQKPLVGLEPTPSEIEGLPIQLLPVGVDAMDFIDQEDHDSARGPSPSKVKEAHPQLPLVIDSMDKRSDRSEVDVKDYNDSTSAYEFPVLNGELPETYRQYQDETDPEEYLSTGFMYDQSTKEDKRDDLDPAAIEPKTLHEMPGSAVSGPHSDDDEFFPETSSASSGEDGLDKRKTEEISLDHVDKPAETLSDRGESADPAASADDALQQLPKSSSEAMQLASEAPGGNGTVGIRAAADSGKRKEAPWLETEPDLTTRLRFMTEIFPKIDEDELELDPLSKAPPFGFWPKTPTKDWTAIEKKYEKYTKLSSDPTGDEKAKQAEAAAKSDSGPSGSVSKFFKSLKKRVFKKK